MVPPSLHIVIPTATATGLTINLLSKSEENFQYVPKQGLLQNIPENKGYKYHESMFPQLFERQEPPEIDKMTILSASVT